MNRHSIIRILGGGMLALVGSLSVVAQRSDQDPQAVVIQPGAPGQPSKILPASTRPQPPLPSAKDIEFMQGMIMHHAQAVEMVDLIDSRTGNKDIRLIGARITKSQADEIKLMTNWLQARGVPAEMAASHSHGHHGSGHQMMMPGMLSEKQMEALRNSKADEFDRLFLTGMIQHHEGALVMVRELFETRGAAQDPELFNFVTDVDSGQRAEIRSMQTLLEKIRKN